MDMHVCLYIHICIDTICICIYVVNTFNILYIFEYWDFWRRRFNPQTRVGYSCFSFLSNKYMWVTFNQSAVISEAVSHNYSLKSLSSFVSGLEKVYGEISSTVRNTSKIQMLCREEEEGLFFWLLNWVSTSVLQKYLDTVGKKLL